MGKICKWCRLPYSGSPVCPSNWGFWRREAIAHTSPDAIGSRCYCSEKCRAEAEGGQGGGGGGDESESAPESSSSDELPSGCVKIVGMILVFLVVCGILGSLFIKKENANDPAVMMEKWEEHLEKRRAAFAEGLPEEGVEARGFKNYTWEEWQARQKNANEKSNEKEIKKETKSLADLWLEHQNKRGELLNQGVSSDAVDKMGYEALALDDFKARYKDKDAEAELKKLNALADELIKARKNAAQQPVASVPMNSAARNEAVAREKAAVEARVRAEAEAKMKSETRTNARAKAEAKPQAEARAKAEVEAKAKLDAKANVKEKITKPAGEGVGGEQQNDTRRKASADSKGIRIVVRGKGKTKDAAVRWALRDAVFKTVGTWVDSKARIQENHDKVVAQVKTITEADVPKFEILETQEQDGGFVVKVRVSVSKKKIAPKFAEIFPDVFANE